jgi:hypothetical protein
MRNSWKILVEKSERNKFEDKGIDEYCIRMDLTYISYGGKVWI